MPEPISIVAGVTTIVSNVYRISKDVYDLIDAIENAPKHILAVSQDVHGLYGVLGPLQGLLQDLKVQKLPHNVFPIFEGLQQPLDHCFWAFRELQMKVCKYTKPTGDIRRSKWAAFRWQFTEKDANSYRAHLASYKLTVDVALAAANLANTSQNIQATNSLERQVQAMRIQLEGLEQNSPDGSCESIDVDNGSLITDRHFALHRFLETAESLFSGSPPGSPTFFVQPGRILPQLDSSKSSEHESYATVRQHSQRRLSVDALEEDSAGFEAPVRRFSTARQKWELDEVKRLHREKQQDLEPVAKREQIQWDGLRRRRTNPSIRSRGNSTPFPPFETTVQTPQQNPPLGMSQFPSDSSEDSDHEEERPPTAGVGSSFFGIIYPELKLVSGSGVSQRSLSDEDVMSRTVIDAARNTRIEDENTGHTGERATKSVQSVLRGNRASEDANAHESTKIAYSASFPASDKAPIQVSNADPAKTKSSRNASKLLSATLSPSPDPSISVRPRSANLEQEENLHNLTVGSRRTARPRGSSVGAHRQVRKAITEAAGFDQNAIPAFESPERKQELEQEPKGLKKGGEAKDERGKPRIFERMRERIDNISRRERANVSEEAWKSEQEDEDKKKAKILRLEAEEARIDSIERNAKARAIEEARKTKQKKDGKKAEMLRLKAME